jgi:hypothetical protein
MMKEKKIELIRRTIFEVGFLEVLPDKIFDVLYEKVIDYVKANVKPRVEAARAELQVELDKIDAL